MDITHLTLEDIARAGGLRPPRATVRRLACHDRMCGAMDCETCRPGTAHRIWLHDLHVDQEHEEPERDCGECRRMQEEMEEAEAAAAERAVEERRDWVRYERVR